VAAAGSWWVRAPATAAAITAVASDQGSSTLAISGGVAGWYSPGSGRFTEVPSTRPAASSGPLVALAASGSLGVVAFGSGLLLEVRQNGATRQLPAVAGVPRALAVLTGDPALLVVASSRGLYSGRLGFPLRPVVRGDGTAVTAPPRPGLDWLALVDGRLWTLAPGKSWVRGAGAPQMDPKTRALTELADGSELVAEPGGLVWLGAQGRWQPDFQVLPYGGLGGVPPITALAADGAASAYLATDGFGTMLTPDGGYSWYRAAPADPAISALATVGPVFAARPHGWVVALTAVGPFLHRLQALPAPPTYSPTSQTAELAGTAAVTLSSALLVTLLLWERARRRRARSV